AAEPRAGEASDLMAEKRDAEERREITHAEYLRHEAVRERNGAKPGDTDHRGEDPRRPRGDGKRDIHRDHDGAHRIDPREDELLAVVPAEKTSEIRADNVRHADGRERDHSVESREPAVEHVRGQMDHDEHGLVTADEKREREIPEA